MLWFSTVTTTAEGPKIHLVDGARRTLTRLVPVPGVAVIELVLEIDAASDPVTGTVCERGSSAQSFTGWTQLGHVLDMAIRTARDQAAVTQAEDCSTP